MPRVIKHPSIRKAELVSTAQALFFERGYDKTSVDEIIARAGISKGAFYYYFPSKEAVLQALAEQMASDARIRIKGTTGSFELSALDRLNALLGGARQLKIAQASQILASFEAVFRPENIALYHRLHLAVGRIVAPLIADIIAAGVEDGSFRVDDARVTAEILVNLMTTTHDAVASLFAARTEAAFALAAADFERRCTVQGIAIDRILGLRDGSIRFIEPGFADAMFAGWQARQPVLA